MVRWGLRLILVSVLVWSITGCESSRYVSNLHPEVFSSAPLGNVKVHIVPTDPSARSRRAANTVSASPTAPSVSTEAARLYPGTFSDDFSALPVRLEINLKTESPFSPLGLLGGFTLGVLPIYMTTYSDYTVAVSLATADENMVLQPVPFEIKTANWGTLFTPLGLLPVPGPSDARSTNLGANASTGHNLVETSTVAAVVQALKQVDAATLQQAYANRQSRIQQVTVDGRPLWAFLGFRYADSKQTAGKRDLASVSLFAEAPTWQATPLETVEVARRSADGAWQPVNSYLRTLTPLTAVSVLLDRGNPARVVTRTVSEPPLEDFIDTPNLTGKNAAETLRWNNGILLEAKNRSLPRLVRSSSRYDLLDLVTRIEKAALDLNEQAERAKDRAQRLVEKGDGDPGPERELAILCRQRIEVLKPILMELKQEAALR